MKSITLFCTLITLTVSTATADTVIEFINADSKSQFLTNGKMARINTRGENNYMLVDFDKNTIYAVSPDSKQITNISNSIPSISGLEPPPLRLSITAEGNGPKIAGYSTKKYRFSANGEHCGSIFASRDALKGTAIESMFNTMKAMADNHKQSLGGFAAAIPVCQLARIDLAEKLPEIGAPMRTLDSDGEIDTEVTMILKDADVATHYYALPADYKMVAMGEQVESVQNENSETDNQRRNMPEMQRMMDDMRRSGQVPPEAMEQMRRYQR
ncbi:MAG: hypothetical protein PVG12_11785 [Gammaproteobacteria bacterium]|jgi:hypothetical protein